MNRRFLKAALLGFGAIMIIGFGCTKLDTTTLGSDLIPIVDNVNTFADSINVIAYQGIFNDTTSLNISDDRVLGRIDNDPDFGKTRASLYLQLKPGIFPYSITAPGDTLVGVDSVVLALNVKRSWGDSSTLQRITVREIPDGTAGLWDSLFVPKYLSYQPIPDNSGALLLHNNAPFQTVDIRRLNDFVKFNNKRDSVQGQIRIRLSDSYANLLALQDNQAITRVALGYVGNGFYNDTTFRLNFEGFAIESEAGNALMTIDVTDVKTRLEIHYRKRRNNVVDTLYTSLSFLPFSTGTALPSAVANKIKRDHSAAPFFSTPPNVAKDEIYLQTTPGTFADLFVPRLNTYRDTNRIIHRAELRITQIPGPNVLPDRAFTPPSFLYLDLRDSTPDLKHKPIYFDLNPTAFYNPDNVPAGFFYPNVVEYGYFGGFATKNTDPFTGSEITQYTFNITRYLQRLVTKKSYNYNFRLSAPFSFSYPQYNPSTIGYPNELAKGRVKVGGTNGNYKMQLKVIWSRVTSR